MIIILCLDNNNGMMFNDRRQSQDRGLREYIAEMTKGEKVYMNAYTEKLYEEINDPVVCEDFLHKAGKGETCIVENLPLKPVIWSGCIISSSKGCQRNHVTIRSSYKEIGRAHV